MIETKDNVLRIREATKLGYIEIPLRERERERERGVYVVDLSFPGSDTRRGRVQDDGEISPTITTTGGLYVLEEQQLTPEQEEMIKHLKIRKLTPDECFVLMGMTVEDCQKCRDVGVSNSQLYKQAGNGLISNCVQYIMEHLYKTLYNPSYQTTDEKMISDGYGI